MYYTKYPIKMKFHSMFSNSMQSEFRRAFKQTFYAWCYSSHQADQDWLDFKNMYTMGQGI